MLFLISNGIRLQPLSVDFFPLIAMLQLEAQVAHSRNHSNVPAKGSWTVRDSKSGRFVELRPDRASKSLDKIADRIKGQPSKLGDLFKLHKEHQSKRA